ncbi:acetate/propionate family kinase [Spirosoma endbachense]|uniref:Acetate kinase n=1 Tax=Spirosoma endbachense TaxID=2666025 RepID=A0A6P1VU23_9BACT|nr:acetate kinase [Spirosoma endbachense]QHV96583.1 acetate/propionate family kinase [Spirosoma endbachense]
MYILVINAGSSSLKYQLFDMPSDKPLCSGLIERIGTDEAFIRHKILTTDPTQTIERKVTIADHTAGLQQMLFLLSDAEIGLIRSADEIQAVGHRVVHGGERFAGATLITPAVKEAIKDLFPLAPLHNPVNYKCIEIAEKTFPNARQIAVFDTAFHQTMPAYAFRYAIPEALYAEEGIRVYGFHGTSHKYVSEQASAWLGKPDAKLISLHLGNGCSITAVQAGKSIDTSMGFSPLAGLVMGTRSGDIDPAIIFHLISNGYSPDEVNDLLNKQSGMQGLTGLSDMRDIRKALEAGNRAAALALDIYAYRIRKYIGAYVAVLNGLDALLFTAGVGENDSAMREQICRSLDVLTIHLDSSKNSAHSSEIRDVSRAGAAVKILVIPTNEELEIAIQSFELLFPR